MSEPSGPVSTSGTDDRAATWLPRILVVEGALRESGGLRVSLGYARRFRNDGAQPTVAVIQDVHDGPLAAPDPALDLRMLTPPGTRLRWTAPLALLRLIALARRADIVLAGSEIGTGLLLGFMAAGVARRPFAVLVQADVDNALRDWVPPKLHALTRWMLGHSDLGICVADAVVPSLLGTGLPSERLCVIPNGIDVSEVRAKAGLPPVNVSPPEQSAVPSPEHSDGRPVVVANGRLSRLKDFPTLVRAHDLVRRAGIEHNLVIMGEGPQRAEIEDTIAALGVADSVTLAGFTPEPFRLVAGADLFVLSSLSEGMPLSLLEALAVGAPIISTRCGAGAELLLDGGRFGDLVPTSAPKALAEAMERHLRDPSALKAKALGGPARAMEFDVRRSARAVLSALTELSRARRRQFRRAGSTVTRSRRRAR